MCCRERKKCYVPAIQHLLYMNISISIYIDRYYLYIYIHVYTYVYTYICIYKDIYMHAYIHIYTYLHIIFMYVCMYACIYVCIYICMLCGRRHAAFSVQHLNLLPAAYFLRFLEHISLAPGLTYNISLTFAHRLIDCYALLDIILT
jgi:hypothetical protein